MGGPSAPCTLFFCAIFQIIALCMPNWLILEASYPLEGELAPAYRSSLSEINKYDTPAATMSIGLHSATCDSSHSAGCRPKAFFQRTPPEPPQFDAGDWHVAHWNLREFWEHTRGRNVFGRGSDDITKLADATRQQVPRWDAAHAQKQMDALAVLRGGGLFKAAISCLSLSVVFLLCAAVSAADGWDEYRQGKIAEGPLFCTTSTAFALTLGAAVSWVSASAKLAPAFGGYDGGSAGPGFILVIVTLGAMLAIMVLPMFVKCGPGKGGPGIASRTATPAHAVADAKQGGGGLTIKRDEKPGGRYINDQLPPSFDAVLVAPAKMSDQTTL